MASRYFVNGGVDNNWGTTSNWSLTDGGAGGQTVPSVSDDVFFTSNSPACTLNASARIAKSLDFTGYTNTITFSQNLTVSGAVTLSTGMSFAGSSTLILNTSATITSHGKHVTVPLTLSGNVTLTLADDWYVDALLTIGSSTSFTNLNGNNIYASGSVTAGNTGGGTGGTTVLVLAGTGTFTVNTGQWNVAITINTSGTITFSTGTLAFSTRTLTYTAGTVSLTAGFVLSVTLAATTLSTGALVWGDVIIGGAFTHTLGADFAYNGTLKLGSTTSATVINGNNINCYGTLQCDLTSGNVSGTTVVVFKSTLSVTAPSLTTGRILTPVNIDAGAGTVTVSNNINVNLNQLKYTSGTMITTAGTWASGGGGVSLPFGSIS